jgi:hypothetical protein
VSIFGRRRAKEPKNLSDEAWLDAGYRRFDVTKGNFCWFTGNNE